jgi:hypothetical protein
VAAPDRITWFQRTDDGSFEERTGTVWCEAGGREPGLRNPKLWVIADRNHLPYLVGAPAKDATNVPDLPTAASPTADLFDTPPPHSPKDVLVCLATGSEIEQMRQRFYTDFELPTGPVHARPPTAATPAPAPASAPVGPAPFVIDSVAVDVTHRNGVWTWSWQRDGAPWHSTNHHFVRRDADGRAFRGVEDADRHPLRYDELWADAGPWEFTNRKEPDQLDAFVREFIGERRDIGLENHATRQWGLGANLHLSKLEGRYCDCDRCVAGDHELSRAATAPIVARIAERQASQTDANPHQVALEVLIPALADACTRSEAAKHRKDPEQTQAIESERDGLRFLIQKSLADPERYWPIATSLGAQAWFPYYGERTPTSNDLARHHTMLQDLVANVLAEPELAAPNPTPPSSDTAARTATPSRPGPASRPASGRRR